MEIFRNMQMMKYRVSNRGSINGIQKLRFQEFINGIQKLRFRENYAY
jgi:hypothetical protein